MSREYIKHAILNGEVIETYTTSAPYPSGLIHAVVGGRPIHVLVGWDRRDEGTAYVVTAYEPDEVHLEPDLKTRKRRSDD